MHVCVLTFHYGMVYRSYLSFVWVVNGLVHTSLTDNVLVRVVRGPPIATMVTVRHWERGEKCMEKLFSWQ